MRHLVKLDHHHVELGTPTLDLPVAASGNLDQLQLWARNHHLTWKDDRCLFGGYYVDESDPDKTCYLII